MKPSPSVVVARTDTRSDLDAERARQARAHLIAHGRDPRLLADEDAVGVHELEAGGSHVAVRLREQHERVGAAVGLVVGREERADVT